MDSATPPTAREEAPGPAAEAPPRLYTIAQAAQAAGMTKKAMRSRVDRSQASPENPNSLRVVLRDGERHIPLTELIRVGLLTAEGTPPAPDPIVTAAPSSAPKGTTRPEAAPATTTSVVVDVNAILARVESLAGELREHKLLEAQASSREAEERRARAVLEGQLHEARAELRTAELRAQAAEARLEEARRGRSGGDDDPQQGGPAELVATAATTPDQPADEPKPRRGFWASLTGRKVSVIAPAPGGVYLTA